MATLEIKDLHVSVKDEESKEEKEILKGVNLKMKTGEIHAIMGPNGTGKSTLSQTIMGHPNYHVTQGDILLDGESIVDMPVDERARKGLFLAMQYPAEIQGVTNAEFLRAAINARRLLDGESIVDMPVDERARKGLFLAMQYPAEIQGVTNAEFLRAAINARRPEDDQISVMDFIKKLDKNLELLDMSQSMTELYLNEGFSGGENKRNEILKLLMIEHSFAILDEIDSGLDIDALKVVSKGVNSMRGDNFGSLIITHYQRLLNYIVPDTVHVMMGGRIVKILWW